MKLDRTHDSIGRKLRDKPQTEREPAFRLTPRDITWLAFIHRHGGRLPTSFIHLSTETKESRYTTSRRLKQLARAGYLSRPKAQFEVKDSEYNELVHELTPKGDGLLQDEGIYYKNAPSMFGAFKHQLYLSCVSAGIELECRKHGIRYYPQHEALKGSLVVNMNRGEFRIDLLCAIEINGKPTLLFIEIDRDTEGNERKNPNTKGKRWDESLAQYHELLDLNTKPFRELFNVQNEALLLVVTVTQNKQDKILGLLEETHPTGCGYVLIKNFPEFGSIFHPPTELRVLEGDWARFNRPPFAFI